MTQQPAKRRYYDGAKIRALRLKRGMSMAVLAKKCSLTDATISNLEHEVSEDPGHGVLKGLAEALGVPLVRIMRDEPAPSPGDDLKAMFNTLPADQQNAILSFVEDLVQSSFRK